MPEKCQNFFLTLRANPSPYLFVLLSSSLGYRCYINCIFVKHVKCPWSEMRETTRRSNCYNLISEVEIVGTSCVGHIVTLIYLKIFGFVEGIIINYYYHYYYCKFFTPVLALSMESVQVSSILRVLGSLHNDVVCMVSNPPLISISSVFLPNF